MPKKILLIQTAFLGDLLLSIPLLKNLKRIYPEAQIHLICRKPLSQLFHLVDLVHSVYEISKGNRQSYNELKQKLSKENYDIVLCPHASFRSHLFLSSIKAKQKIGYKIWWNLFFLSHRLDRKLHLAEPLRLLQLLRPLDKDFSNYLDTEEISYMKEDRSSLSLKKRYQIPEKLLMSYEIKKTTSKEKAYVVLAPGSVWNTKRWTKEGYLELAKKMVNEGKDIVILGTPEEETECKYIEEKLPVVKNLCGKTNILQAYQYVQSAEMVICNDSGPMHMASMANVACVAIFGPTVLELGYQPWQNRSIVVQKELACRPCGKHGHKKCPIGTHDCMKMVSVEDVWMAVKDLENAMA